MFKELMPVKQNKTAWFKNFIILNILKSVWYLLAVFFQENGWNDKCGLE